MSIMSPWPSWPTFALVTVVCSAVAMGDEDDHVRVRGDFQNAWQRFERQKQGHVAFIGGSITEMNGYRPLLQNFLQSRFPDTEFEFTDAGIASTCSTTGAFRLRRDVLSQGPVDLLFIEFAVNDDQDARHATRECVRGMEGLIRQALRHNPRMDIIVTYFLNPEMLELIQRGETPVSIAAHEQVAKHYNVTTVHLAREVADRIQKGTLTWKEYGGTHPAPAGNAIPVEMIANTLKPAWSGDLGSVRQTVARPLPEPLDDRNYERGRFLPADEVQLNDGWKHETPDWGPIAGTCRERFRQERLYCTATPGAVLTYHFSGTGTGAYLLAGPDAGTLEFSIDNGPWRSSDVYHHYSKGLHYPRTVMFDADLPMGEHSVRVRLSSQQPDDRPAPAARILHFVAN